MKIIDIAKSQLGVSEQPLGSNDGPQVKEYLKSAGIDFPAAWCAAFVVWCHLQASINSIPKTGGVLDLWNKSPDNRVIDPQPGDVMILDYGNGQGHTGIVIEVNGNTLTTIEGNTNDDGSREGYEVAQRSRSAGKCKGFLRFV
ncbi:MAG: CHAP domain-containing protein [Kluyvera sp.]|uniref:CHAP domain-containing protein n=1 Tax=Kluyvera sp. TaxID=1538228 RepID=UPI003A83DAE4